MAIYDVCFEDGLGVKQDTIEELVKEGLLVRAKSGKLSMSKDYQSIYSEIRKHPKKYPL